MVYSDWVFVENQDDLNKLNDSFYWGEGATTVEFFGCQKNDDYFPEDISRSGFGEVNLHLLVELLEEAEPGYVEFVLIHCEKFDSFFLNQPSFKGRVDSLKRVYLEHPYAGETRCARLIYRSVIDNDHELRLYESSYFKSVERID
jgi:hypothetical protein